MIQMIVKDKVAVMDANGDSFAFLLSERDWQNLVADEIEDDFLTAFPNTNGQMLPAVFMDMPIRSRPKVLKSGAFVREYICVIMFLYKSDLDDNPLEQYTDYEKAEKAQEQFQLMLSQDRDNINSYSVGECYQVLNYLDTNLSGVVMPCSITPRNSNPVCTPIKTT
jgi:hypothetical protein